VKKVNKKRALVRKPTTAGPDPGASPGSGRVAQRNRTRRTIVDATMQLVAAGATPSMAEIAQAAQVSRRTLYMYFPTLEQLLIDATLGALTRDTIDPVLIESASNDPADRVEKLSRALNSHSAESMRLGRALIRLTIEGDEPSAGGPRRGYRRVQWIEQALAPAREMLTRQEFDRVVSALCVLIGWEPMITLKDVRCLDQKQVDEVLAFAVRAVVEKALRDAESKHKSANLRR
jgi:AcrR family transcriptional regulator